MVIRNSLLGERCTLGLACRYLRMHLGGGGEETYYLTRRHTPRYPRQFLLSVSNPSTLYACPPSSIQGLPRVMNGILAAWSVRSPLQC